MTDHLILIDGYNVIRRSPQLAQAEKRSLQHGRDALITLLAARYSGRAAVIVVVFDGAEEREMRNAHLGISIVYSAAGVTADECILRLACEAEARGQHVTVATDDAGIRAALGGLVPTAQPQSAAHVNHTLYAPDRTREKQYRHRAAIKQILTADTDAAPFDPRRPKRGNPRKAPRKKR
jgi:predicted RNA-binding protein with PIN domain